jgi:hypothetical protein
MGINHAGDNEFTRGIYGSLGFRDKARLQDSSDATILNRYIRLEDGALRDHLPTLNQYVHD